MGYRSGVKIFTYKGRVAKIRYYHKVHRPEGVIWDS